MGRDLTGEQQAWVQISLQYDASVGLEAVKESGGVTP